jgi:formate-dependent nitrite reductase membrane component NrfD
MPLLKSPDWPLLIDLYFFLGGLAAGAFVIATVAHLLGGQRHREVVRVGYYVALLAVIPAPLLLILDLGIPSRFLHMLASFKPDLTIGREAILWGPFHLKPFSPMSMGAWGLLGFGLFSLLAALSVFVEDVRPGRSLSRLRTAAGIIGGFFAFFLAAYPGVLLGASAPPLLQNAHFLGLLFLAVGMTSGAAAIMLILSSMGPTISTSLAPLRRIIIPSLTLQVLAIALFLAAVRTSGAEGASQALAHLLGGGYGVVFWLGAVVVGSLVPLVITLRSRPGTAVRPMVVAAVLILVGGFLVKYVIIAAGQVALS